MSRDQMFVQINNYFTGRLKVVVHNACYPRDLEHNNNHIIGRTTIRQSFAEFS